jgi:hypothetical protein
MGDVRCVVSEIQKTDIICAKMLNFYAHSHGREKRLLASSYPFVRWYVRVCQRGCHWMGLREI